VVVQPERERRPRDARAGDQNRAGHTVLLRLPTCRTVRSN
jgi:hypothetical protein